MVFVTTPRLTEVDTDLVRRLRAGDRPAFEAFFSQLIPGLRRMALRYFQSPFEQQDALQEALVLIYRQREHLDPLRAESAKSWAYTLARRRMIDLLRARGDVAVATKAEEEDVLDAVADTKPDAAELLQHQQLAQLIREFESRLKPAYRTFFHAVFVEGRDFDEARELLGLGVLRARYLKKVLISKLRRHQPLLDALGRRRS